MTTRSKLLIATLLMVACSSAPTKIKNFDLLSNFSSAYYVTRHESSTSGEVKVNSLSAKAPGERDLLISQFDFKTAADAEAFKREKIAELLAIYDRHHHPKVSTITARHGYVDVLQMSSDEHNTLGVYPKGLTTKEVVVSFVVCSTGLFQVESYIPVKVKTDADRDAEKSIDCLR